MNSLQKFFVTIKTVGFQNVWYNIIEIVCCCIIFHWLKSKI